MANSPATSGIAAANLPASPLDSEGRTPSLALFLLLPAVAMSLGWGLRGTIGGGQIGAMIPGAVVTLCLCHLLGWNRSLGIVAAIGTVGVGLGGQETYGQTIGFLREPATVVWGLCGLTIKGAMWGLSGGVLVGLGLMHAKYRPREIALGLVLMIVGTTLGWWLIDEPKLAYFSNRIDKPREEVWVGLTVGALALLAYLKMLNKENVSAAFAWGGLLAGGAGFGIGGAFIALGFTFPEPYRGWPWWKVMEFTFGMLYGLGMGAVCYRWRRELAAEGAGGRGSRMDDRGSNTEGSGMPLTPGSPNPPPESRIPNAGSSQFPESDFFRRDPLDQEPVLVLIVAGLAIAVAGLWLNFTIPFRATFSIVAPMLVMLSLFSNLLAWHIALSMTACGFIRDLLRREVANESLPPLCESWGVVALATIPLVVAVAIAERKGRLSPAMAILGMTWHSTLFGLAKVAVPVAGKAPHLFVPAVFVVEAIATTALVLAVRSKRELRDS